LVTVAIALSLLTQVPPVVGDNVALLPTQTDAGAVTTGGAFTVMIELHDTVLPQSSVVVQVTVWAPTPNTAPFSDVPVLGLTPASVEYVNVILGHAASAVAVASQLVPD